MFEVEVNLDSIEFKYNYVHSKDSVIYKYTRATIDICSIFYTHNISGRR